MTREERLKALFDELERDAYNAEYHNYYYKEANQIIRKHFEHPLPPAEGAEQRIRVRNILQDFYRRGEYELEQAEEDIMRLFQQQPTAEGAEEILTKHLGSLMPLKYGVKYNKMIDAMQDFATLHAQRIAEKMVEEGLREELIKYDKYIGSRGWIDNYEDWAAITSVDEYLKSREK